jgi:hypothetical protein
MAIIAQRLLFGWQEIEPIGDLGRLHLVLNSLELSSSCEFDKSRRRHYNEQTRVSWESFLTILRCSGRDVTGSWTCGGASARNLSHLVRRGGLEWLGER